MTSGGHARSGPPPVPGSGASDRKGLRFKYLPAEGYKGEVPEYPQPIVHGNELHYWKWAWRQPQAALWATPQWSFLEMQIADWCSEKARAENPDAPAAVRGNIAKLESKILLDHIDLKREGYAVASDDVAAKRDDAELAGKPESARDRARRLRVVGNE